MKLLLGLLITGLSIPALPQSAKACFLCDPVAATKAAIKRPHRVIESVVDPLAIILNTGSGQMGGRSPSQGDDYGHQSIGAEGGYEDFDDEQVALPNPCGVRGCPQPIPDNSTPIWQQEIQQQIDQHDPYFDNF
ncbi:hypothetical protein [Synechococcus sp. CC9311]|uniref:hypothetical protein n=1 Tax=Synechococcus sp. (strain CC9311) TaxID=64471 RepID=UPI0000DDB399|nr:hypothetical protein [Synechococcus sp. CC9311]ABI45565.1 hypothetical protein sync_2759 [Synechococcus sp. CC9311]